VLSAEFGLQDAWGSKPAPGTYVRGTECIDHVYVSHDLLQCIQSVNYLPFPTAYSTDHKLIQLQFNMKPLIHTSLDSINLRKKKISSNNMINDKAYITERFKLYKHHKIQDKMEKLLSNPTTPNKLNIPRELLI
jgi:hypothetical protein